MIDSLEAFVSRSSARERELIQLLTEGIAFYPDIGRGERFYWFAYAKEDLKVPMAEIEHLVYKLKRAGIKIYKTPAPVPPGISLTYMPPLPGVAEAFAA